MHDYYDPYPRIHLEESIVVTGHPGSGAVRVSNELAARTGLPFTDVARWSESAAGRRRARVAIEDGPEALRELDRVALARGLARQPRGFLGVASDTLTDPASLEMLAERCVLVFVRRPVEVLWRRIHEGLANSPGSYVEFVLGAPETPADLEPLLAERRAVEAAADAILDADDRHVTRLADEMLASLERLTGVAAAGFAQPMAVGAR